MTLGGTPKYPPSFTHFDYANPRAPKGGTITLSAQGGFDTLNPFTLKGRPAFLLSGLVFESLTTSSMDEPFTEYGLLAQSMEVAPDELSIVYRLNPRARFSDGQPVTAADVVFSFQVLRTAAASPFFRYYYQDVQSLEALGPLTVRVRFARRNRELPLIMGQLPILPQHIYGGGKDFGADFVSKAVGSGPYTVDSFDFGKIIRYRRDSRYWGGNLAVNAGRYNFDNIAVKYFRDGTVELEALKAGDFDFLWVNSAKQWAVDATGDKWNKGWLVKEELRHSNTAGMQGYVFNLRRPIFDDRRVRKAIALALDFPWTNRTLFYGQYIQADSYFANSELAARGLPAPAELRLLQPLRQWVPPDVFTQPMEPLGKGLPDTRSRLREAEHLLRQAGYGYQNGVLTQRDTGRALRFMVTLVSPAFQRITEPFLFNLRRLGIQASMRVVDDAVYQRLLDAKDFDMVVQSFGESQSPGNEQRDYWSSASADQESSSNIIGIKNPAVDALVNAIIQAPERRQLVTATHALDRVLWFEYYAVPQWYLNVHRVTYWDKFDHPALLPLYYNPYLYLAYWWFDSAKALRLERSRH